MHAQRYVRSSLDQRLGEPIRLNGRVVRAAEDAPTTRRVSPNMRPEPRPGDPERRHRDVASLATRYIRGVLLTGRELPVLQSSQPWCSVFGAARMRVA